MKAITKDTPQHIIAKRLDFLLSKHDRVVMLPHSDLWEGILSRSDVEVCQRCGYMDETSMCQHCYIEITPEGEVCTDIEAMKLETYCDTCCKELNAYYCENCEIHVSLTKRKCVWCGSDRVVQK